MEDIYTKLYQMPTTIAGYTVCNADGSYTIIINSAISNEKQLAAYKHELDHIYNGDFERKLPADMIEIYAHNFKQKL